MREGCRRALAPVGHQVDMAPDLSAGRQMIASNDYDLVLVDLMLPDGSGLDLIDFALEQDPSAVCIVITGYGTVELAVEAVRRGAYNFLAKPFTADTLLVAVEQGLERRELKAREAEAEELQRAKEALEQLDAVKSQFMLQVAHELRAPVAAVQSYVNLILSGYVTDDELKPTLKRVQQRLQEVLALIADLLELARLKQADEHPTREAKPHDLATVLEEIHDMLADQAREKGLDLEVEISARPVVRADREHLKQIWTNLLSNAIKYTPPGGRVTARVKTGEGDAIGTVEDTGIGITEAEMEYLFEEFFRSEAAKASGEIGTGLGLSIVKHILNAYNGEIRVTSKQGQGSRFTFTMPLAPDVGERGAVPPP
jgi:signal transduction histidine kinase